MSTERAPSTLEVRVRVRLHRAASFCLDVDFAAPAGVTVLFGPSGSGKSTTLAAIAGLSRPVAGRIALGAKTWFDADARVFVPVHARRVAYVFQALALFPHMTAAQNVAYGLPRAWSRAARRDRAVALLEQFRVGGLADRKPPTFSGGEAQRVALARALAIDPSVVLLDEPFSALDRPLRLALLSEMRDQLQALGVPVLLVTHHEEEVRALGDRLLVLEDGRVRHSGPLREADLIAESAKKE